MAALASILPNEHAGRFPNERLLEADGPGRVGAAFAFLTSDEREVLELCFSAGCTPAQISSTLQMPLGAIKARTGRGESVGDGVAFYPAKGVAHVFKNRVGKVGQRGRQKGLIVGTKIRWRLSKTAIEKTLR